MCGLVGIFGSLPEGRIHSAISDMTEALIHRGPDDMGVWVNKQDGVALGHRRLSILDLSDAGHQPMVSPSGRFVFVYNGEIYNHLELRKELERAGSAPDWRGHSDTETLLAAFEAWGVEATLEKCVGMFAFALYDSVTHSLVLARDRLGEKPLYYGWVNDSLVFGSELKALRAFPGFANSINRQALSLFMRYAYVPCPWSIYENVWKLPPACLVRFSASELRASAGSQGNVRRYWSLRTVAERGLECPFSGSRADAAQELERLLQQSVANQMLADVPLGAFLSGGIDSSTIVALTQAQSGRPAQTFTIGFHEEGYNEAEHAHRVASHLGTEHTELYITPAEARAVIPKLPNIYDEPFADSSQIPTFLVARLAKRHVTVALSGDGGDELFGGYNRYFIAARIWQRLRRMPSLMRNVAAYMIRSLSPRVWDGVFGLVGPLLPDELAVRLPGDKLHKLAGMMEKCGEKEIYHYLVSFWHGDAIVKCAEEPTTIMTDSDPWLSSQDLEQQMMYLDTLTYLPDDILAKVDRAAMSVSLETRLPMLDHRLVEFAWSLPLAMKVQQGQGKLLLRQVLYHYVPKELIERPKMGFGIPLDQWLRGPLRQWADSLIEDERLKRDGLLDPVPIRRKWEEHLSGRRNWQYHLWNVLMFQAWLQDRH